MNIFTRTIHLLFYLFYGLAGKSIHPAPNYNTQWTTAIHGLTYDDTIEAEEGKQKTLQLLFQSIIAVVFDNKVLTMYFD